MLQRCYNHSDPDYYNYGGKGVAVCDEWIHSTEAFETWMLEHGYSDGMSIDRINVDKDYCPENCRLIPVQENARFKSTTNYIEVDGEIKSGKDWSACLMLGPNMINTLMRNYGDSTTKEFIRRRKADMDVSRSGGQSWIDAYNIRV